MLVSILLVLSLCIDSIVASFAYGTNKITIPLKSNLVLTFISTIFLVLSMSIGTFIHELIPENIAHFACFGVLFSLGFMRLFEGLLKNFLNKKALCSDGTCVNIYNFKLILHVYADNTSADMDQSHSLNPKEAIALGIALSLDSLLVGIGIALSSISFLQITVLSLVIHFFAIILGSYLGTKCAKKLNVDLGWLSGAILMLLAILRLF